MFTIILIAMKISRSSTYLDSIGPNLLYFWFQEIGLMILLFRPGRETNPNLKEISTNMSAILNFFGVNCFNSPQAQHVRI